MSFLPIFYHHFISEEIGAEAMHVRNALTDEFVGLGFIEKREDIFQQYVGKFSESLYYATVLHAEEGWISIHRSSFL